jgi:O-antigen/teichoic acid export membrane protein
MRFANYIKPTFWALLDKALPVAYGFGFLFVVVRVLPKAEFGLLVLFQSIFYFIVMVDTALVQMPMAKFIADGNQSGWAITSGFLLSLAVLVISSTACVAGASLIAGLLKAPVLADMLWYLPLLLAALYFKNLSCQIFIARHQTAKLFCVDALYFLGSLGLLALWQMAGRTFSAIEVILINIYAAAAASLLGVVLNYRVFRESLQIIHWEQLKRFIDFGKYSLGGGLASYVYMQADSYLISFFYNPAQVGVYNAGKIIYRFYNVISQAAQVLILPLASRLAATEPREELRALLEKAVCFFYFILIPLNGILLFGAGWIFSMIYGDRYGDAVGVFRWLVVGAFFIPWGTVGSNVLFGMNYPRLNSRITWLATLGNIVLNLILLPNLNILGAAIANAVTMAIGAIMVSFYLKRLLRFSFRGVWQRRLDALNFAKAVWSKTGIGRRHAGG